jgi:hypothetical protein
VIQPGGKIVAVGHAGPHESTDDIVWRFVLARLRPNGSLDPTFGGDGRISTHFAGGAFAAGVATDRNGRLVVAGGVGDANAEGFVVARYLP